MKSKIELNKNNISNGKTKYYILMIQKLFNISESGGIQKLKKFNCDFILLFFLDNYFFVIF